jgi:hypothetical protein
MELRKKPIVRVEEYTRFLKIFPQYFAKSPRISITIMKLNGKKIIVDLEIKLNIFDQNKTTQCIFWYMLFNFMQNVKLK